MRALLLLLGLGACQQYASLKAKYVTSEPDWQHMPASGPPVDHMADQCGTPLHDDEYYGFSVGRPQGWRVDYSTGTIVVSRDESDLVAALVYPARMRHGDLPPEQLLQNFSNSLARSVRNAGGAYQLADKVTDGHVATALATATLDGVKLRGQMQVLTAPGFATLKFCTGRPRPSSQPTSRRSARSCPASRGKP